jgi:hypothetical protein
MDEATINEQRRLATFERIAGYAVGVAVEKNAGIGTGTLITDGTNRYVLTAAHVIGGADIGGARFWLRPNSALIEKAAMDTTDEEVGRMTMGMSIPIVGTNVDPSTDIALLTIDDAFVSPGGAEFYDLRKSHLIANWPGDALEGVSIAMFGFPTANSRPVKTIGNNTFCFLGLASMLSRYSIALNSNGFKNLSADFSPEKDFLFAYTGAGDNIHPRGFSGCGV